MEKFDYREKFFNQYVTTHIKYFEKISPRSFEITAKGFNKHIVPFLPEDKSARILDIACGPGHLLHFLQSHGYYNAQGIDLGAEQLEIARKMGVKNIKQADFFQYIKENQNQFDLIVASNIIEHFKKPEAMQALCLINEALKPRGKILVITPNALSLAGLYSTFGDFTHEMVFTPRSLSQLLRVFGFSTVKVYGLGPVAYDFKSEIRAFLWRCLKNVYKICFIIEQGTGRSIWENKPIFEGFILAVGEKKD